VCPVVAVDEAEHGGSKCSRAAAAVEADPADHCSGDVLCGNLLVREENMPLLPGAVEDLGDDW